jgi:hypothetical protein
MLFQLILFALYLSTPHPSKVHCKKISDVGQLSFCVKYDSYDIYESRKIKKQKIVLTVLEILQFCVLFQLHLGLSYLKSGCNWNSTQKHCIFETEPDFLFWIFSGFIYVIGVTFLKKTQLPHIWNLFAVYLGGVPMKNKTIITLTSHGAFMACIKNTSINSKKKSSK